MKKILITMFGLYITLSSVSFAQEYYVGDCNYYGDCANTSTYFPDNTSTFTPDNTSFYVGDCSYYGDCTNTSTYFPDNTSTWTPTQNYQVTGCDATFGVCVDDTNAPSTYWGAGTTNTQTPCWDNCNTTPIWNAPNNTYTGYTNPCYDVIYSSAYCYTNTTPAPTYIAPTRYPTYNTPTYTQPTYTTPSYNWNTSTNTNTNSTYAPVWNYNTNTNTNTNINNTCAGQNNCNNTYTYTTNTSTINGSFNTTYTQPTYVQPTPVCTNGATNYPSCTVCPAGLVFQNGSCVSNTNSCPTGQYWNGSSCVTQTRVCPNGQTINYWEVCPNQTQTCWNGAVIPVTSVCPSQYKTCPNGTTVLITQQCYKTCSNGTTVLDTQTCNRVCPNGTVVPEYQYCPIINNTYPTVDINVNPSIVNRGEGAVLTWTSQNATYCTASNGWSGNVNLQGSMNRSNLLDNTTYTIVCYNSQGQSATDSTTVTVRQNLPSSHRVVTTAPTQITKTSARCNGVGIISNNVLSSGWFEYGETRELGRVTNSASIGSLPSSPFGNTITGLKANTTYYCRAVMSNANGTYRGEILSFRTTGDVINYIPVTPKTPTKTPAKPIICADDTGAKESLAEGEKLMSITLDKKSGIVAIGNEIEYRAHYLNTSKIKLTNTTMKIVLPSDMTFVSSNRGIYDEINNTVTANLDTVPAGDSGDMIVKVKVKDGASVGKSAVVSTYISYDALDSKGNPIRDENTAYVISTIASAEGAVQKNTDVTNKVSNTTTSDRSFLPSTVLEWLAIIALIFVLIVLGRAIYTGLKGEAHNSH